MATKQVEDVVVSEDNKERIIKRITKVINNNGTEDIYIDTIVELKESEETFQTEHESLHSSGLHNVDYIGKTTTHIHERPDGSLDVFDEDDNGEKDRDPYSL